jgi:hypothetical protein
MDPTGGAGGAPGAGGPPGGAGGPPGGGGGPPDPSRIPAPPTDGALAMGFALAGVGVTLNIISFIVFSLRVYARTIPVIRLSWDDYTISLAFVSFSKSLFSPSVCKSVFVANKSTHSVRL